jgi:hypothetical protein
MRRQERKHFFFEKKKQKTFICGAKATALCQGSSAAGIQTFEGLRRLAYRSMVKLRAKHLFLPDVSFRAINAFSEPSPDRSRDRSTCATSRPGSR